MTDSRWQTVRQKFGLFFAPPKADQTPTFAVFASALSVKGSKVGPPPIGSYCTGANARPEMQREFLGLIAMCVENPDSRAALVAAGAISPLLLRLAAPGSSAVMQGNAAGALDALAEDDAIAATIAASGAIPVLLQVLGPGGYAAQAQTTAAMTLRRLADLPESAGTCRAIVAAGAIPVLVQVGDCRWFRSRSDLAPARFRVNGMPMRCCVAEL